MKTVLSVFVLSMAVSTAAVASPAVGDIASYSGTATVLGKLVKFQRIDQLVAFDASKDQYNRRETTIQGNQEPKVEEKWVASDSLVSDASSECLLSNCTQQGGTLESVVVPAGTFQTCKMENSSGYVNFANVPFGIVKLEADGWSMELVTFSRGQ